MLGTRPTLNLWEAADALGIEPWRLSRLARYLGIDPGEKRMPSGAVQDMAREKQEEARYCAVRRWLISSIQNGTEDR